MKATVYKNHVDDVRCLDPRCGWRGTRVLPPEGADYGPCPNCGWHKLGKIATSAVPPSSSWVQQR